MVSQADELASLVDAEIEAAAWSERLPDLERLAQRAVGEALVEAGAPWPLEVSLLFADDKKIADLNDQFRGKPTATNVLSWPYADLEEPLDEESWSAHFGDESRPRFLGDVAFALETIEHEAQDVGVPLEAHVSHLIIHGVMHLCGYDHISNADAEEMEAAEIRALARLGVANPYAAAEASRRTD